MENTVEKKKRIFSGIQPSGELTLVNASEDKEKAYRATANTSHDFGKMLEEATLGQGAKCC